VLVRDRTSVEHLGYHGKLTVFVLRWRQVGVVLASDSSYPLLKGLLLLAGLGLPGEHVGHLLAIETGELPIVVPHGGSVGQLDAWLLLLLVDSKNSALVE